jgi:N utilization substance protein B
MSRKRDIRRLAMQVLYQLDLRGEDDAPAIRDSLGDGPDAADVALEGFNLALAAWRSRADADALATQLAPQWPTHRQPPVDRAILRLADHELRAALAPFKIVINEAIELAKEFGSEQSAAFINGLLDKIAKHLAAPSAPGVPGVPDAPAPQAEGFSPGPSDPNAVASESETSGGDPWLHDAVNPQ